MWWSAKTLPNGEVRLVMYPCLHMISFFLLGGFGCFYIALAFAKMTDFWGCGLAVGLFIVGTAWSATFRLEHWRLSLGRATRRRGPLF